jgi:hypothetical protein
MTDLELSSTEKQFTYQTVANQVEKCQDIDELKTILLKYCKLYLKQQEVLDKIGPAPSLKNTDV